MSIERIRRSIAHGIPYRCSYWTDRERCDEPATHAFTVHGEHVEQCGVVCERHGRLVVDEYTAKIPEEGWSLVSLDAVQGELALEASS